MTVLAKSLDHFLRSSRLGAISIALVAYVGLEKLLNVTQVVLAWAIPASFEFARRNGLTNMPELPYRAVEWEAQGASLLVGLLLVGTAVVAVLKLFQTETATGSL